MAYFSEVAPWFAAIEVVALGFFITMAIRYSIEPEHKLYFLPYSTFWAGMTLGFGLIAYFVSRGTQDYHPTHHWYDQFWFMLLIGAIGMFIALQNSYNTQRNTGRDIWTHSEWWLWLVVAPILTPVLVRGIIVLAKTDGAASTNFAGVIIGLSIYVLTLSVDALRSPSKASTKKE